MQLKKKNIRFKLLFFFVLLVSLQLKKVLTKDDDVPIIEPSHGTIDPNTRILYWFGAFILTVFAGIFSGLTVGLLSLDPIELKILLLQSTSEKEKAKIRRIIDTITKHHLLIVTLLLGNTACMECLPIFLDRLLGPIWGLVIACTIVLFFGEILPQALFTGEHQITIAAAMIPLVQFFQFFFSPLAIPLAKLLDRFLGIPHDEYYEREHLKMLIRLHGSEHGDIEQNKASMNAFSNGYTAGAIKKSDALNRDEICVIEGALDLSKKKIQEIIVPYEYVFALEINTKLTRSVLEEIVLKGHSRIPIYEGQRHNIRGLLLVKQLILLNPEDEEPVRNFVNGIPLIAHPDASIYDILNEFQVGLSHISLITEDVVEYTEALEQKRNVKPDARVLGIVTLEDIIEELIQEEILDEFDGPGNARLLHKKIFSSPPSAKTDTAEFGIGKVGSRKRFFSEHDYSLQRKISQPSLSSQTKFDNSYFVDVVDSSTEKEERKPKLSDVTVDQKRDYKRGILSLKKRDSKPTVRILSEEESHNNYDSNNLFHSITSAYAPQGVNMNNNSYISNISYRPPGLLSRHMLNSRISKIRSANLNITPSEEITSAQALGAKIDETKIEENELKTPLLPK